MRWKGRRLSDNVEDRRGTRGKKVALGGVWAHHAQKMKNILEEGDIDEAMNAAAAVGDDRMMKRQTGMVVPDAFTHGTSEQRASWFMKGFRSGDIRQGNTFAAEDL
jgi:predicted metalloprotease